MKYYTPLPLIALAISCAFAQTGPVSYEWTATMKVVDEDGNPISGAKADIGYYAHSQPANDLGLTDTNGIFTTSHSALSTLVEVSLQADRSGYYTTWVERMLPQKYDPAQWSYTQTLVLKKVRQPIAMYAKYITHGPPVFNTPVGYDLMVGDWVAPNGKGMTTDIIFNGKLDKKAKDDFDYTLTVSFPKPGDGIQEFTVPDSEKGSGLRSPHEAPTNGYQAQVVKTMSRHPGQGTKEDMNDPNRNYFFRARTVLDENGNVINAYYGKIYGDFMQFTYYLNPTPNSHNIEFDPKQNLLNTGHGDIKVNAP